MHWVFACMHACMHLACTTQSFSNKCMSFKLSWCLFFWQLWCFSHGCQCAGLWFISLAFTSEKAFGPKPITHSLMTQKPCRFSGALGVDEISQRRNVRTWPLRTYLQCFGQWRNWGATCCLQIPHGRLGDYFGIRIRVNFVLCLLGSLFPNMPVSLNAWKYCILASWSSITHTCNAMHGWKTHLLSVSKLFIDICA